MKKLIMVVLVALVAQVTMAQMNILEWRGDWALIEEPGNLMDEGLVYPRRLGDVFGTNLTILPLDESTVGVAVEFGDYLGGNSYGEAMMFVTDKMSKATTFENVFRVGDSMLIVAIEGDVLALLEQLVLADTAMFRALDYRGRQHDVTLSGLVQENVEWAIQYVYYSMAVDAYRDE